MTAYADGSMLVSKIIADHPETIDFLVECGMHCLGCPASQEETLQEACAVHGLDTELVLEELNLEIAAARSSSAS